MLVLTNTINFLLETQPQNSNLNALLDAISKVKDPSTLIAFLIFASIAALMIVMSSTQGLNRVHDTLLKDTAISGKQFERMFFAILIFMTALSVVLFGFLCFQILYSQNPTSIRPKIEITYPDGDIQTIKFNTEPYFYDLKIKGTSSHIEGNRIWLVIKPLMDSNYYPFGTFADIDNNGN
jgi:hypothetical protein